MLTLTADNAADYVRRKGWATVEPIQATWLSGGVSNVVLRIETPNDRFVLKQSCPQLRTRDAWFSDVDRIFRELEAMQVLQPRLPAGIVPQVRFVDRDNFTFAMEHAPLDARPWKEILLEGRIDPAIGTLAGKILGQMHEAAVREPEAFAGLRDRRVFDQLRIDPFYRRLKARHPEVAPQLDRLTAELNERDDGLCHGDYTPKNMLVHSAGFTLVDYETACVGDPTFDVGLCLAHLLLKAMRDDRHRSALLDTVEGFADSYFAERKADREELLRRTMAHLGACMLTRIDGTSPVDYLQAEHKRAFARFVGTEILGYGITSFLELVEMVRLAL